MLKMNNKFDFLRNKYPTGTRVRLVQMDDVQAPPVGTLGTVMGVDDLGSILVSWDNGSSLSVVWKVDQCEKVTNELLDQIIKVRDTGLTNMFDTKMVQRIAFEMRFFELVDLIEEDKASYIKLIMYGE